MKQSVLLLDTYDNSSFRTIFKTTHGRSIYLSLEIHGDACIIMDCIYTDRTQKINGKIQYTSHPLKLRTTKCNLQELLVVIANELDKAFSGYKIINTDLAKLAREEYIQEKLKVLQKKYNLLIMIGAGEHYNGLPANLCTRLENRIHRLIYFEIEYYADGNGVVKQCHYYDRVYKHSERVVTPPQLISCFFPYNREEVLSLINNELNCDFTHMIVTNDLDPRNDIRVVCGHI